MNRLERLILGVVFILVLVSVYGVLVYRTTRPRPNHDDATQDQAPSTEIKAELLQSVFIDRLRALEVNGNLPVEVVAGETYQGHERNPFEKD